MKFKVGDKVKTVKSFFISKRAGMLGTVVGLYSEESDMSYRIAMGQDWSCPVFEDEVEKIYTKGQQLLFSFME